MKVTWLGLQLVTPGSAVRRASDTSNFLRRFESHIALTTRAKKQITNNLNF